jgi:co-chaperonin GroES (HSP10)
MKWVCGKLIPLALGDNPITSELQGRIDAGFCGCMEWYAASTRLERTQFMRDIVLVKVEPVELMSNGLYAPAEAQPKHVDPAKLHEMVRRGTVMYTGPGVRSNKTGERLSMDVKAGDKVCFSAFTAQRPQGIAEPTAWGDDLLMMHESEILGQLVPDVF